MVQLPIKVKDIIDRYLQALDRNHIPVKESVLFGGMPKGFRRHGAILILHWSLTFL